MYAETRGTEAPAIKSRAVPSQGPATSVLPAGRFPIASCVDTEDRTITGEGHEGREVLSGQHAGCGKHYVSIALSYRCRSSNYFSDGWLGLLLVGFIALCCRFHPSFVSAATDTLFVYCSSYVQSPTKLMRLPDVQEESIISLTNLQQSFSRRAFHFGNHGHLIRKKNGNQVFF